jgi:hypothetical protein
LLDDLDGPVVACAPAFAFGESYEHSDGVLKHRRVHDHLAQLGKQHLVVNADDDKAEQAPRFAHTDHHLCWLAHPPSRFASRCELPAAWPMAVTVAGAEPAEVGCGHRMSSRLLHSRAAPSEP